MKYLSIEFINRSFVFVFGESNRVLVFFRGTLSVVPFNFLYLMGIFYFSFSFATVHLCLRYCIHHSPLFIQVLWYAHIPIPDWWVAASLKSWISVTRGTQEKSHDRKYFQVGEYDLNESLCALAEERWDRKWDFLAVRYSSISNVLIQSLIDLVKYTGLIKVHYHW